MKKYFALLLAMIFVFAFELFGEENKPGYIEIYDHAKIINVRNQSDKYTERYDEIEPIGKKKNESILKSIAIVTPCKSSWKTEILKTIKAEYPGDWEELKDWWKVTKVIDLKAISCATINYQNYQVVIIYFKLIAEKPKDITGNNLLWISLYNSESLKIGKNLYVGVSNESIYDIKRNLRVKMIADIDNDSFHEIILKDQRYAGYHYLIIKMGENGEIKKQEIDSLRGD